MAPEDQNNPREWEADQAYRQRREAEQESNLDLAAAATRRDNFLAKCEPDIIVLEDGFRYFAPGGGGALSADNLRVIADELDSRNAEWSAQVDLASRCGSMFGVTAGLPLWNESNPEDPEEKDE